MKARLWLLLTLLTLSTVILSTRHRAAAAPDAQPALPQAEALQALAYGRVLPDAAPKGEPAAAPRSLLRLPDAAGAVDGPADLLTFASNRQATFDLYTMPAGGGAAQAVVSGGGDEATPNWSPDGRELLFASDRDGDFEIYVRDEDGSTRRLTANDSADLHPSWSPDGSKVLFSSNRGGGYFQLYEMDADGQGVRAVGSVPGNNALYPRYAPDGQQIAFMRASTTAATCAWNWDIWLMKPDGSEQRRVTNHLGGDFYPQWTPDGRILYGGCRSGLDADLFVVDPFSGAEERLNEWLLSNEWNGTLAADGDTLAFNSDVTGNAEIVVASLATGDSTNLTQHPAADLAPSWSAAQPSPGPCAGANVDLQPLLLAPGWDGVDTIAEDGNGFSRLLPFLEQTGYRLNCNLFYAGETSAAVSLPENAAVIHQDVCELAQTVRQVDPAWDGRLDIIGHSFGGIRARVFLEDDALYDSRGVEGARCGFAPGEHVFVENLITLGTPHAGGDPSLPGALFIGAAHVINPAHWVSLEELLLQMPLYNRTHAQPQGVCYRLLGGNAMEQALPFWLHLLYAPWTSAPNDLGVYRYSAQVLDRFPERYPYVNSIDTADMHGYIGLLPHLASYVYPDTTFTGMIKEALGEPVSACRTHPAIGSFSRVDEPPPTPTRVLVDTAIAGGGTVTGSFAVNEGGAGAVYLTWPAGDLALTLTTPTGQVLDAASVQGIDGVDYAQLDVMARVAAYSFERVPLGVWQYEIQAGALPVETPARIVFAPEAAVAVDVTVDAWHKQGAAVPVTAAVTENGRPLAGAVLETVVTRPDSSQTRLNLYDDGLHGDGAAGDGLYSNSFAATGAAGVYAGILEATVSRGVTQIKRTADVAFTVTADTATLTGDYADRAHDTNGDGRYEWLEVDVPVEVKQGGTYRVSGELVAPNGRFLAHAADEQQLDPGRHTLRLGFPAAAIAAARLDGPYTLANLALLDVSDTLLLLDEAAEAHTTAAYDHRDFLPPPPVFLPLAVGP